LFAVAGAVLFAAMAGHTSNRLWSNVDFWVHVGPVREFAERPFSPRHPLVATDAADTYLSPFLFVLGGVSRLSGIDPVPLLAITGLISLVGVLVGVFVFARAMSSARWTPLFLLAFTALAWGWRPWTWSGYLNLNSMGTVLPLSSTFATALALLALTWLRRWLRGGGPLALIGFGVASSVVVLSHQMTGLWLVVVAGTWIVVEIGQLPARSVALAMAVAAGCALVIVVWPFYAFIEVIGSSGEFDAFNDAIYDMVPARSFLMLPGVAIVAVRLRSNWRDPVGAAAVALGLVFTYGWLTGHGSLGRVFPGLVLMLHLAMAHWVARVLQSSGVRTGTRRVAVWGTTVVLVAGSVGTAPGWAKAAPRDLLPGQVASRMVSLVQPLLGFDTLFEDGDVVVADPNVELAVAATSAQVVSVHVPQPFVVDLAQRQTDTATMLDPATDPTVRAALLDRYEVEFLVVSEAVADKMLSQLTEATTIGSVAEWQVLRLSIDDAITRAATLDP
jgi:hypothetical protein